MASGECVGHLFTYLKRGGSIGSFCISTMRITLCLAPELKATPCWDGVYLGEGQRGRTVSPYTKLLPSPTYTKRDDRDVNLNE